MNVSAKTNSYRNCAEGDTTHRFLTLATVTKFHLPTQLLSLSSPTHRFLTTTTVTKCHLPTQRFLTLPSLSATYQHTRFLNLPSLSSTYQHTRFLTPTIVTKFHLPPQRFLTLTTVTKFLTTQFL